MRHLESRATAVATTCALLSLVVAAVATAGRGHEGSLLKVQLREMSVAVSAKSVDPGKVTFAVKNAGNVEHELVVMRSPASGKLQVSHFKVGEKTLVGEVEGIAPGKTGRGTFTLKPGKYFLICNIAGHYQLGMATELMVGKRG
jgi:uncharacterized cupredoxin-like copper-binding protein